MQKSNNKWLLVILLTIATSSQTYAQHDERDEKDISEIVGRIIDEETQSGLEFATVALLNSRDSSIVSGAVTDTLGRFSIKVESGVYHLRVDYFSYVSKFLPGVVLKDGVGRLDIGDIQLKTNVTALGDVEVTAERSRMELSLDKRVFNIGKDLANIGGSASDLLGNIPSITVDIDGALSFRGSSNVRILIDGKPSGLIGINSTQALQQFPANLIERVEIVSNPSARYDAQGQVGIINIILKKNRADGFNGSVDLATGYPFLSNASVNFNYRKKKFNYLAMYGFRYGTNPGQSFTQRTTTSPIYERLDQDQQMDRERKSHTFRGGIEYFLNDKTTFSTSLVYGKENSETQSKLDFLAYDINGNLVGLRRRNALETEPESSVDYNFSFRRTFNKEGMELTADFQYEDETEEEGADISEQDLNLDGSPIGMDPLEQISFTGERGKNTLAQVDFIQPLGKSIQFETGYRGTIRDITNNFSVRELNDLGEWIDQPGLVDNIHYKENVQAGYVLTNWKSDNMSLQVGLRVESTKITIVSEEGGDNIEKKFTNLFPSTHLTFDVGSESTLQLSYSKRVNRPDFWDLNPFSGILNSQNIRIGNPDINPEFTNSYELSHIKNMDMLSFTSGIYHRHTKDVIQRVTTFENGVTTSMPINLATRNSYGLELSVSSNPTEWMSLDADANFFRSITNGMFQGEDFGADAYSWSGRLNSNLKLGALNGQISFNYRAPQDSPQGRTLSVHNLDLGFNKDILNGKGTVSLRVRDLFNTRKRRNEIVGNDFFQTSEFQWQTRQLTAGFIFRINQKKKRQERDDGDFEEGEF